MEIALIILPHYVLYISAEIHTLHQYCTATSGIKGLPAYIQTDTVDDKVLSYYDSITQRKAPAQCMKSHLDPQFWNWSIADTERKQHILIEDLTWIEKRRNQTGVHVLQRMFYCEWDDETKARGKSCQLTLYDGEDIALSVTNRTGLTQEFPQSSKDLGPSLDGCGPNIKANKYCFKYLENYLTYGKECLKKVPPELSLFQNSSAVVSYATGFYPKAVNITWKRDGMEIKEDVYVGKTLPNGDGSFQKRVVLTISPEERRKSTYTCEVEHKTGLVIKTLVEENSPWSWIGIGIGIGIGILFGIGIGIGILVLRHNKQDQEAPSWCLELINRNDRSSIGSAEPMMAGANNVPTYS